MNYWLSQVLNGVSFGMLLFFLAAGLTLTLGVMRVTNLTHGSFYLVGAYLALDVVHGTGSFVAASVVATAAMAVFGLVVFGLLRLVRGDLRETLLTFGLVFIVADLSLLWWGGNPMAVPKPALLSRPVDLGGFRYPSYRLFIIAFGALVAGVLEFLQRRTLIGAMVRAVVDDVEVAGGIGLNARVIGGATFVTGAALAGLSGALGGAMIGVFPGADIQVLLLALVVVIIGGMGSLTGSLVGALAVGLLDTFGRVLLPELGASLIFLLMLATLLIRPSGLFGRRA